MPSYNLQQRLTRMDQGRTVNVSEVGDDLVSSATSTAFRVAMGTGTLVSGTVAVATGLNTVVAFVATISGSTGFATGVTEVSGIKVGSITTGSVTVTGTFNSYVTGAATLSASGTGVFNWLAFGT